MSSYIGVALGFLTGVIKAIVKILEIVKTKRTIEDGKRQKETEIINQQNEINIKQTEILIQDRTKKDVIDKMKDGTF